VDDCAAVEVLERFGELVHDEPDVYVLEDALRDDVVQVCLHELEQQVYVLVVVRADGVHQLYDIGVVQLLQDLDLPVRALRVGRVLECVENFL